MPICIVVVQFDLAKRSEEPAVKGATSTAPTFRGLAKRGLIRKDYLGENGNRRRFTSGTALNRRRYGLQKCAWPELSKRFGVRPRLTWYDTYVTVYNLRGEPLVA
jgi:hypothetical protein